MHALEALEQIKAPLVIGAGTRLFVESRDRFEIVVEDVRRVVLEDRQRRVHATAEIRHQHFDRQRRRELARLLDAGREVSGTAVLQIVAIDRKSVVSGKSVSVRVDLGGRRIIKNKTNTKK